MAGQSKTLCVSREQFLQNLKDSGLSVAQNAQRLLASPTEAEETDGMALARRLVGAGELTSYQAEAVLEGRHSDLRIGAYEVLDLLGKGAMGTVYKARHLTMKRVTAVKVLSPEVAKEATFAQRFQREVETLAQLSHPNIVMAFDAGESAAGPFLAMEFIQGRDLASEVKAGGPLSVADALNCILQAARGLEYAHQQGLIHRDIKPGNLMRDVRGVVKVADLGLARINNPQASAAESGLTQAGWIVGTVDYIAPEQAVDSTTVDHRVDIYSLGCTLFYLLTGRPMYSGTSLMGLLLQHRDAPPPALPQARPDVPEAVNRIYLRMVAKNRYDRYASMSDLILALEDVRASSAGQFASTPRPAPWVGTSTADTTVEFSSGRQLTGHGSELKWRAETEAGTSASPLPGAIGRSGEPSRTAELNAARLAAPTTVGSSRVNWGVILAATALAGVLIIGGLIWWQLSRGQPGTGEAQSTQAKAPAGQPQSPLGQQESPAAQPPHPSLSPVGERGKGEGAKPGPFAGAILNGGGSTFVSPLIQHWAGVYEKSHGVRIEYQAVGSSRGLDGVLNRVYSFGCSDAPLSDKQIDEVKKAGRNVVHVPLVLGAAVPAYNLPGVASDKLRFTGPILADIYLGKITHWNDPALKIANPGVALPDLAITPVHRGDGSGTTYIWTDYLSAVSGEWKSRFGAATKLNWPGGLEGTHNNGVANQISRTVGSIGYLELTYALENNLHFGQVKNREGKFVTANLESVTAAAGALNNIPEDLRLPLVDAAGEDTYPIAGMSYALVYTDQTGNPYGAELVGFLRWATHEGQAYVKDLRYAPLPPELVQRIDAALGTVQLKPR
jgi:phosphate ABC transporter phosphate-binding protein